MPRCRRPSTSRCTATSLAPWRTRTWPEVTSTSTRSPISRHERPGGLSSDPWKGRGQQAAAGDRTGVAVDLDGRGPRRACSSGWGRSRCAPAAPTFGRSGMVAGQPAAATPLPRRARNGPSAPRRSCRAPGRWRCHVPRPPDALRHPMRSGSHAVGLGLALGPCPIRRAGSRPKAPMPGKGQQLRVEDERPGLGIVPRDQGARIVEEHLLRHAIEPCLARLWHKGVAPGACTPLARGVGDRNEPRA